MTTEIPVGRGGRVALIDDADVEAVVSRGPWSLHQGSKSTRWYARTSPGKRPQILMHRFLTGWTQTDHINLDGLDNQRKNLRPATTQQNSWNTGIRRKSVSGYKGVTWSHPARKWRSRIGHPAVDLGLFKDPVEAAIAYDIAAVEMFGQFAHLNFPLPEVGTS